MRTGRIHQLKSGRWIVAEWDEARAQWIGLAEPHPFQGYCYTFSRTLDGLASYIRTYASRASAVRAMRRRSVAEFFGVMARKTGARPMGSTITKSDAKDRTQ